MFSASASNSTTITASLSYIVVAYSDIFSIRGIGLGI
jgi:hypothetical protein